MSVPDENLAQCFLNERANDALIHQLDLTTIDKAQQQDKALLSKLKAGTPNLQLKTFCGGCISQLSRQFDIYT